MNLVDLLYASFWWWQENQWDFCKDAEVHEMSETRVIYISPEEADLMQSYLDSDGEARELDRNASSLMTYTAIFDGDIEVDIKVCKGDPPFVDAILYDSGSEVELIEISDELLGEYMFFYDGQIYTVVLEEGMGEVV